LAEAVGFVGGTITSGFDFNWYFEKGVNFVLRLGSLSYEALARVSIA
jgi:hypothetical protein